MLFHIEYDSNHGTEQGIWPRFYLQMESLGELAVGRDEFNQRSKIFLEKVIPELTNFYDLYHRTKENIEEYKEGVKNGKYFAIGRGGHTSLDRLKEIEIRNDTKDFIIRAKIVLVNFIKCRFVDEPSFKFEEFYFCNESKFTSKKEQYAKETDRRFMPIILLLENENKGILSDLNIIRGKIEHDSFSIDKFPLTMTENGAIVSEPLLQGISLSEKLDFYYEGILEFIEKVMAYYLGINGEISKAGFLQLHVDTVFDYSKMNYKYTFALGGTPWSETSQRCSYN